MCFNCRVEWPFVYVCVNGNLVYVPPPCLLYVRMLVDLSAWFPMLQYSNHCRRLVRGRKWRFRLNGGGLRHNHLIVLNIIAFFQVCGTWRYIFNHSITVYVGRVA